MHTLEHVHVYLITWSVLSLLLIVEGVQALDFRGVPAHKVQQVNKSSGVSPSKLHTGHVNSYSTQVRDVNMYVSPQLYQICAPFPTSIHITSIASNAHATIYRYILSTCSNSHVHKKSSQWIQSIVQLSQSVLLESNRFTLLSDVDPMTSSISTFTCQNNFFVC